jgi:hypothetical protein
MPTTTPAEQQRTFIQRGAVAGAIAPAMFLGVLLLLDVLAGKVEVSGHELGPRAWLMYPNFALFGILLLVFARALGRQLGRRPSARVAIVFLTLFGLGPLLGTFTTDPDEITTWHGAVHVAGFLLVALSLLPGLFAFAFAFHRDPRWRGYDWFSLAFGIAAVIVVFAPQTAEGDAYPIWTGPASMLQLVLIGFWIEVVALRLRGLSRPAPREEDALPAATAATT